MSEYIQIKADEVPEGVRFDVNGRDAGQIVERAYGGFSRAEHGYGDPYMRINDQSTRTVTYYRLGGAK